MINFVIVVESGDLGKNQTTNVPESCISLDVEDKETITLSCIL
jgi:hypothetical protein